MREMRIAKKLYGRMSGDELRCDRHGCEMPGLGLLPAEALSRFEEVLPERNGARRLVAGGKDGLKHWGNLEMRI